MADFTVYPDIDTLLQSTSNAAARSNLELGTAATTASTDYATAAQGTTASSALQPSAVGVSVQAYSSVLQGTTASFTTAEETKLTGIATGAEVNTINTTSTGEPATSNLVENVVSISQTDYDAAIVAGTTVTTTFYIIT